MCVVCQRSRQVMIKTACRHREASTDYSPDGADDLIITLLASRDLRGPVARTGNSISHHWPASEPTSTPAARRQLLKSASPFPSAGSPPLTSLASSYLACAVEGAPIKRAARACAYKAHNSRGACRIPNSTERDRSRRQWIAPLDLYLLR